MTDVDVNGGVKLPIVNGSGHELNLSLSGSMNNMAMSQIFQIPQFTTQTAHNPNIYAAP